MSFEKKADVHEIGSFENGIDRLNFPMEQTTSDDTSKGIQLIQMEETTENYKQLLNQGKYHIYFLLSSLIFFILRDIKFFGLQKTGSSLQNPC